MLALLKKLMKFIFTKKNSNSIKDTTTTHDEISDDTETQSRPISKSFVVLRVGHRDWSGWDSSNLLVKSNPSSAGNLFMSSSVYSGTNQYILFLPKTWFINKRRVRSCVYVPNPQESTIIFLTWFTCSKFAIRPRS